MEVSVKRESTVHHLQRPIFSLELSKHCSRNSPSHHDRGFFAEFSPQTTGKKSSGTQGSDRVTSGKKNPSDHGSNEPHFHEILKQDSSPNRFCVGSTVNSL